MGGFLLSEVAANVLRGRPDVSDEDMVAALRVSVQNAVDLGLIRVYAVEGDIYVAEGDPFRELPLVGKEDEHGA